jgi:hypothetical protein
LFFISQSCLPAGFLFNAFHRAMVTVKHFDVHPEMERFPMEFVCRHVRSWRKPFRCGSEDQIMEFVMTGRSVLLASTLMAVAGIWAGSAGAAPIHADMSLQGGAVFEHVQMRGDGGNRGGGMSFSRGGSANMSVGRSSGGNWSGSRAIGGGNFAATTRSGNWSGGNWSGRRNFADWRNHRRGFRGPVVAFGFGPSYYDYGYDYGYYDYPYDDAYAYVAPGPAVAGDDVAYCQQRFRSYDPSTGTYLGYDGLRHPCP